MWDPNSVQTPRVEKFVNENAEESDSHIRAAQWASAQILKIRAGRKASKPVVGNGPDGFENEEGVAEALSALEKLKLAEERDPQRGKKSKSKKNVKRSSSRDAKQFETKLAKHLKKAAASGKKGGEQAKATSGGGAAATTTTTAETPANTTGARGSLNKQEFVELTTSGAARLVVGAMLGCLIAAFVGYLLGKRQCES